MPSHIFLLNFIQKKKPAAITTDVSTNEDEDADNENENSDNEIDDEDQEQVNG